MKAALKIKLTDARVKGLVHEGEGDRTRVWDSALPGFGVVVHASGRKQFFVDYRTETGRQRRMVIKGVKTVADARQEADQIRGAVAHGEDPLADRKARRAAMSLEEFWTECYLPHVEARWKARTHALNGRLWEKRVGPEFGKRPLNAIRPADVQAWNARWRGTPGEQNLALRLLKAMLNLAVELEMIPAPSPAARVKAYPGRKMERFLNGEELKVLFEAIDLEEAAGGKASVERAKPKAEEKEPETEGEGANPPKKTRGGVGQKEIDTRGITPHAAALFRLLLFTGARLGEIMGAKWLWVDWEAKVLRLPDSKTGKRAILLSSFAVEELRKLEKWRTVGNPWIIEGREEGEPLVNAQKPWRRVRDRAFALVNERRKEAKLDPLEENPFDDVRLHDLRHSFASIAVSEGLGLPIVGKALGHTQASTTERYAHLANDPVAAGVELVGASIMRAVKGPVAVVEEVKIAVEGKT